MVWIELASAWLVLTMPTAVPADSASALCIGGTRMAAWKKLGRMTPSGARCHVSDVAATAGGGCIAQPPSNSAQQALTVTCADISSSAGFSPQLRELRQRSPSSLARASQGRRDREAQRRRHAAESERCTEHGPLGVDAESEDGGIRETEVVLDI